MNYDDSKDDYINLKKWLLSLRNLKYSTYRIPNRRFDDEIIRPSNFKRKMKHIAVGINTYCDIPKSRIIRILSYIRYSHGASINISLEFFWDAEMKPVKQIEKRLDGNIKPAESQTSMDLLKLFTYLNNFHKTNCLDGIIIFIPSSFKGEYPNSKIPTLWLVNSKN